MLSWKLLSLLCILSNVFTVWYIFHFLQKEDLGSQKSNILPHFESRGLKSISVVIHEFEEFKHNLNNATASLCSYLRPDAIFIVSENIPYPPVLISTHSCEVRFIQKNPKPSASYVETRPEFQIPSDWIFIVTDNVKFPYHIDDLPKLSPDHIFILSAAAVTKCQRIDIDAKNWTLTYHEQPDLLDCDAVEDINGALVHKTTLFQINQPFARPFPEALFIQAKLRNIKLKLLKSSGAKKPVTNADPKEEAKMQFVKSGRLDQLYRNFGLKKVIDADREATFHGCTKESARCFGTVVDNMPSFLYEGKWTPPCCLEHLRETARHVFKVLETYKIRYWLEGGSLLGAVRNGDIIAWDYDVDIGVYTEDLTKLSVFKSSESNPVVDEFGFVWEKALEGDFFRVQFSQSNRLHVDIFPFYSRNGTMTKDTWFDDHPQDTEFPEHFLEPLSEIPFVGVKASAPNDVMGFLELKFGKGVIENPKYPLESFQIPLA